MKNIIVVVLLSFISVVALAATEDNLKIIEVGAWAEGNSILYL